MSTGKTSKAGPSASRNAAKNAEILPPPELMFVPISGNEAAKGRSKTKRAVRAHVTRLQHARSSAQSAQRHLQSWRVKPQTLASQRIREVQDENQADATSGQVSSESDVATPSNASSRSEDWSLSKPGSGSASDGAETVDTDFSYQAPLITISADKHDPFWTLPVNFQPYLPAIVAHYVQNLAIDVPDLDGPNERGLLRQRWFPLAMEEPATMYAVLLMAASHFCNVRPGTVSPEQIMYLKSKALEFINKGLQDTASFTSDAMIGAVVKVAAFEAVFGDSAVYATHMRGLMTMLKMRGGLSRLGLDGLLERMVVWIDYNAAIVCGMTAHFGNEQFPTSVKLLGHDLYNFAGIR